MYFNKVKYSAAACVFLSAFSSAVSFAGSMGEPGSAFNGHFLVQLGGYSAIQGTEQDIHLRGNPVSNRFTVKTHNQGSGLVGLGYMLDGPTVLDKFPISYGIDTFFLGQTSVSGHVIQSGRYKNFSYRYKIQNIPLYFDAKTVVNTKSDKVKLAFDVGIGPNFMSASRYFETALNDTVVAKKDFSSRDNVNFSVTVGAGLRFNDAPGRLPIELGYRFFYLGQGKFHINHHQASNALKTGDNYANALVCTVIL